MILRGKFKFRLSKWKLPFYPCSHAFLCCFSAVPLEWAVNPNFRLPADALYLFSIYTLNDLGDLSNLIGSLSRTIQQYSTCGQFASSVFFPFFRDKILGLTFFKARKDFVFPFTVGVFCARWIVFTTTVYSRRRGSFSWTQRFLTRKIWPKHPSLFLTNKFESKCFAEILRFKLKGKKMV